MIDISPIRNGIHCLLFTVHCSLGPTHSRGGLIGSSKFRYLSNDIARQLKGLFTALNSLPLALCSLLFAL